MENGIVRESSEIVRFKRLRWKSKIQYNLAVVFNRGIAGAPGVQKIMARAMGLRSDGQAFWSAIDLPMIVDPKFNWMKVAKLRLDTFLSPECQCGSDEKRIRYCKFHYQLVMEWHADDEDRDRRFGVKMNNQVFPPTGLMPGAFPNLEHIAKDYPWVVKDNLHIQLRCLMCDTVQPFEHMSPYVNRFILDHSHCGFPGSRAADDVEKRIKSLMTAVDKELPLPKPELNLKVEKS